MQFQAKHVIAGKYELERELGRGGMGSLWVALDRKLLRRVAIKFIETSADVSAATRTRFEREARSAARVRSPHVVQIHDYGIDGDLEYIVMELLEGEDLRSRLERVGRLPFRVTAGILDELAQGLDAVHEAGIVHRDLKPANVFLAQVDGREIVKLLDFGVAWTGEGARTTRPGMMIGTPKYMTPEQLTGAMELDLRSDLWSLGVIAFRMLTGEEAFRGVTLKDLYDAVCSVPLRLPSRVLRGLPDSVDRFFTQALARDRRRRLRSAGALAGAFAASWPRSLRPPPAIAPPALSHASQAPPRSAQPWTRIAAAALAISVVGSGLAGLAAHLGWSTEEVELPRLRAAPSTALIRD